MSSLSSAKLEPARIMVWSTPRSVSTAFARSMSARGDTEVFWEPYLSCHNFGPDRAEDAFGNSPMGASLLNDKYSYKYVNSLLKAEYPGAKVLFVKGMVEGIKRDFSVVERSYKHSFLIRHPRKAYRSVARMVALAGPDAEEKLMKVRYGEIYQDLERFYNFVETELDQGKPPVIDADDLVKHPEKILPKYCEAMGIEYTPKMLEWESIDPDQVNWHCKDVGIFTHPQMKHSLVISNAMKGEGFGKAPDLTQETELPPLIEEMVSHALPAYEKLYALRIQPQTSP